MSQLPHFSPPDTFVVGNVKQEAGDQRRGRLYCFTDEVRMAVRVALATGRPLLVRGPSGCGKSSLAPAIANVLEWRYFEHVVTSRTQARDLLYEVDLVARLHDAQIRNGGGFDRDYTRYVEPRALWWAFNPESARRRGASKNKPLAEEHYCQEPANTFNHPRAVVLIDEIDKADPDVPNNLLVPLGSLQFRVEENDATVLIDCEHAPLIVITSNDERDLPPAFLRRCIQLNIPSPDRKTLLTVGKANFSKKRTKDWVDEVLKQLNDPLPSTAEFIDILTAVDQLRGAGMEVKIEEIASIVLSNESRALP